eukprot:8487093-Pyramimonas_sp.AAC.1
MCIRDRPEAETGADENEEENEDEEAAAATRQRERKTRPENKRAKPQLVRIPSSRRPHLAEQS